MRETASYILFSAKTQIYKLNTHTYTQTAAESCLFQFCLTITKPFSPFYFQEIKTVKVYKQNTYIKWSLKVFISSQFTSSYLALKLGYIDKTHTHMHKSAAENSLFQFCLTITEPFSILSRGNEKLLKSERFTRRQSGNYATSQAHRCIQINSAVKTPRKHLDVLL